MRPGVVTVVVVAAACGSKPPPPAEIEHSSGHERAGATAVLYELGHGTFLPLVCEGACGDLPWVGTELRDSAGAISRITDSSVDDCEWPYPEPTLRVRAGTKEGVERDAENPGLSVIPSSGDVDHRAPVAASLDDPTRDAIESAVSAYLGHHVDATSAHAEVVNADFDGDGAPDRLYLAGAQYEVDADDETWEAIVFVPGGGGPAVCVTGSDREDDMFNGGGAFDLDADGTYQAYFTFGDDDGEQVGVIGRGEGIIEVVRWIGVC
jgi:hypothetical protein